MDGRRVNVGVLVYTIVELMVFLYVSFIFYKMGRNTEERYSKLREKFTAMLPFFKSDRLYFAASLIVLTVVAIRVVERLGKGF